MEILDACEKDAFSISLLLEYIFKYHQNGRPDIFKGNTAKYNELEVKKMITNPNNIIFVAKENETVKGYLISMVKNQRDDKILYIDDLCVDKDCHTTGIGKALMEAAYKKALELNLVRIELNVWEFNEDARHFYEHLGYSCQRREMELILKK